ncbi:MAG: DUF2958 domain-containing protein [Actinomycetota bacterium]|nr:DUF2958 domain-containing protein [Actinomycetota bacterium]
MITNELSNTNCYECGKTFSAAEWEKRHDAHADWCLREPGQSCECEILAGGAAVHGSCCYRCNPWRQARETNGKRRGHRFYPRPVELDAVPTLYATEGQPLKDRAVALHYFVGACDWWVVEYDPEDAIAFGYVSLGDYQCAEWGLMSFSDMEATLVAGIFPVERDLHWTPQLAKDCKLPGSPF